MHRSTTTRRKRRKKKKWGIRGSRLVIFWRNRISQKKTGDEEIPVGDGGRVSAKWTFSLGAFAQRQICASTSSISWRATRKDTVSHWSIKYESSFPPFWSSLDLFLFPFPLFFKCSSWVDDDDERLLLLPLFCFFHSKKSERESEDPRLLFLQRHNASFYMCLMAINYRDQKQNKTKTFFLNLWLFSPILFYIILKTAIDNEIDLTSPRYKNWLTLNVLANGGHAETSVGNKEKR